MKATRFVTLIAIGIALSFFAAGCKTHPENMTRIPGNREQKTEEPGGLPPINPNLAPDTNGFVGFPLNPTNMYAGWPEDPHQFEKQTVHFAFDSSTVRSSDKANIATVADFLKGNQQDAVRVEGNCDERGTEEYNRSLGERRALAAREELIRLGIDPTRVVTISYGEDKPVDPGHNEAAWKQNRRDDFILLTPPGK
jgi:peptidoglycan-associated lipoprotein